MKIKFVATIMVMAVLSACGKHEGVHAVDKLKEAEEAALAKAPKAEEMIFDDHGQPTFAETSGAGANTSATNDAPKTDADATATEDKEAKAK